jgi:Rieske Fe-S protein
MNISRRRLVKLLTFGTASSVLGTRLWQREVMAICTPQPEQTEAMFKVRLSDYPALQEAFGSVRIGINPISLDDFPVGNFWPILINRDEDGLLHVLDCECRHASCVVRPYDTAEPGIRCPCHGSLYGIDGSVMRGPAEKPLWKYPSAFDSQDTLTIRVPCWGFPAQLSVATGAGSSRVRLDFPTFPNVVYEVQSRQSQAASWVVAPFATAPEGELSHTSLLADGSDQTIYVDRLVGMAFYAVSMKLNEL